MSVLGTSIRRSSTSKLIATPEALAQFLSELVSSSPAALYIDLEGHWLSRRGCLDIITILAHPHGTIHLIDVYTLQDAAFTTSSVPATASSVLTLKSILEDSSYPKYLWDVRNDADALQNHYGIRLRGVTDLQLLETAARSFVTAAAGGRNRMYIRSLATSIQRDLGLSTGEIDQWAETKERPPSHIDLSESIFRTRPLPDDTIAYCANDVVHLPALHAAYLAQLPETSEWHDAVRLESERRCEAVLDAAYDAYSHGRAVSPWAGKS
ncbi:ribonuclease H-like domain-containing protein [Microdochium bolleyi]|uniref:Ribonuclease H-like domain-containing protein n=1 Tax=Microdochium bolleyi TaxID=196109 RepID=A0A136IND7_9PEZI|nr:ribonuclease H-like domain-containing protein [Microdochium bolleyi]